MRFASLLLLLLLLASCSKDSMLRFELSEQLQDYLPSTEDSILYSNGQDSLYLKVSSDQRTTRRLDAPQDLGSLGTADYIELEDRHTRYQIDTLSLEYELTTEYAGGRDYPVEEYMTVQLRDTSSTPLAEMKLSRLDSLRCQLNCTFADTLLLDSTAYYQVHYSGGNQRIIYINRSRGLAAFAINGQLFKRL